MFFMSKKIKAIKFIIFCCFFSNIVPSISQTGASSITIQSSDIALLNNIIQHDNPRKIPSIIFEDFSGKKVNLRDYSGKLVIVNFWAIWCEPCKKEMPSLDSLKVDKNFKNLKIFAVNMEQPNKSKTKNFFTDLNIKNLEIFFDNNLNFVKEFKLRGVPTTVLINKKGEEFARIIGEANFQDKKFIKWLQQYD